MKFIYKLVCQLNYLAELFKAVVMFKNKVLLISGGTGSFGNAVLQRFLDSEIKALQAKGHEVNQIQEDYDKAYGPVSAIYKDVENEWTGAADVRVGTEKVETL